MSIRACTLTGRTQGSLKNHGSFKFCIRAMNICRSSSSARTTFRFSSTCAGVLWPTMADTTYGVDRATCSAAAASLAMELSPAICGDALSLAYMNPNKGVKQFVETEGVRDDDCGVSVMALLRCVAI
jgi:hypothetical protein